MEKKALPPPPRPDFSSSATPQVPVAGELGRASRDGMIPMELIGLTRGRDDSSNGSKEFVDLNISIYPVDSDSCGAQQQSNGMQPGQGCSEHMVASSGARSLSDASRRKEAERGNPCFKNATVW